MKGRLRKIISSLMIFVMISSVMPSNIANAAPKNITITNFDYIQENKQGSTSVRIVMQGSNFLQALSATSEESVIKDILVRSGSEAKSLMQGEASRQGVKVEVTDSLITITAPKTGDFTTLNVDTNGVSNIIINTKSYLPVSNYSFDVQINKLPSMPGSLDNKRNYVGQELTIEGENFTGVDNVVIAGASHQTGAMQVLSDTKIKINKLIKGTLNKSEKIQFIKKDTLSNTTTPSDVSKPKPVIKFTSEYVDKVTVFEKLKNMDELEVLPSEGPARVSSKITVRAKNGNAVLENIFNVNNQLFLRKETNGKEEEIKLNNVKLVKNSTGKVIAIEGWTPLWTKDVPTTWNLIVKDTGNPTSEGVKENAFTFVSSNPAPQITGISPSEGGDTGGTDVMITGRNIINVNTPGIKMATGEKIVPNQATTRENNDTLVVKYNMANAPNAKYGQKQITNITRKIKVRIASMTSANAGDIKIANTTPKAGEDFNGKKYGKYHYTSPGADAIVVTTTNASTSGPQDVILEMDTVFSFSDGSQITIPEATKYASFTYNEKNPTPKIKEVEISYGYFNDSAEESQPPAGGDDGIKPLMLRIEGEKFEAYKGADGKMKFPQVDFILPDNTVLPVTSSTANDDTKVLDEKGNPIDGIYNKVGTTLVVSVIPPTSDKYGLRRLIGSNQEQPGGYKNLEGIIQVTNPSGNHNTASADSVKFEFRRPTEGSYTDTNSKQPTITQVLYNKAPLKKLPSDTNSEIEIRVKAVAGISDSKKILLTVDGKDISKNIKSTKLDGEETVIIATVPKGFVGKSRLQVIVPEGLMDSYQIIFDSVRGPEIKELIPSEGDKSTIVVIKRDTQANEVSFKTPLENSNNESEKKGSLVLWNGQDINELFNGYDKSGGTINFQTSDVFTNFKQKDKNSPSSPVKVAGKYVYVVDADTIYLQIPNDTNLKEGSYNIQIKNPDGSESSDSKIFKIKDTIDKTKILSISPNTDDIKGGIIATIKAGVKDNIQTNFKGGVDVYIGSQKAEIVGYDIDNKEVYVKIPPLTDFKFPNTLGDKVESYTVPVTVQNKVNKSTDTVNNGFIYLNPNYDMKITQIYNEKFSTDPTNADANKGVEGDYLVIRGENLRLETDSNGKYILPKVMFGYNLADEVTAFGAKNVKSDGSPQTDAQGRAELEWIKVKVPKQPTLSSNSDNSVDILVQNPDGAKTIKQKGFIYKKSKPSINQNSSILQASRFHDVITVRAKDINKSGLTVAFGDKTYEKELSSTAMELETSKELEKIVIKYIPNTQNNIEIYYKKADGSLMLMTDTENTQGGKTRLKAIGDKLIVGLNWKNPAYHSTEITKNPSLVASLNTEYMEISSTNKAPNVNTLVVRRGLGKLTDFKGDTSSGESTLTIQTPYYEKSETTTIELINTDGSSAKAPFKFHGGLTSPQIDDINGTKSRNVTIQGKSVSAKVYTTDISSETEITIEGKNFKDVQRVLVGEKEVEIISVSNDYTKIKVKVPKGDASQTGIPQSVTVVTKDGSGYSDKSTPPVYFMFIQAGTKAVLKDISPAKGPQTGGTKVTITGTDFSDIDEFGTKGEIEVYFAGKKGTVNKLITNEKGEITGLIATTPSVETIDDKSTVVVKNADEGRSEGLPFKYISQPVIDKIEGDFSFYAEAGEDNTSAKITITGKNFYNPKKLIIGGKLIRIEKNNDKVDKALMLGVKSDGSNQYMEIEKNADKTDTGLAVEVKSESPSKSQDKSNEKNTTSFTVELPSITAEQMENMKDKKIFVINDDGGVSPETNANIKMPVPEAPHVRAKAGYNNTITLSWEYKKQDRNKATRFEIYVREKGDSNEYKHVGDIGVNTDGSLDYSYTVKDLKADTHYQFVVRVMNSFGEAEDFGYASERTMRPQDDYKQKEKIEEMEKSKSEISQNGTKKIVGNSLIYTVRSSENKVDIGTFKQKTKEIRIPVSNIKSSPATSIQIIDTNMRLSVPLGGFLGSIDTNENNDAVVIKIQNKDNKINTMVTRALPKNRKRISDVYKIDMYLAKPKKNIPINTLSSAMNINLLPNNATKTKILSRFNENTKTIQQNINPNITNGGYYVLLGNK